jgi:hypothetical protein
MLFCYYYYYYYVFLILVKVYYLNADCVKVHTLNLSDITSKFLHHHHIYNC